MKTAAIIIQKNDPDAPMTHQLGDICRDLKIGVEVLTAPNAYSFIAEVIPPKQAIVFIPAIEEDYLGVKLAQHTCDTSVKRVIVMYAQTLPEKAYICLAFREGVDDIIALDASRETCQVQVRRAEKLLENRVQSLDLSGQLQQQIEQLHKRCEQLERTNARWEERILSLAATAGRMATGELSLPQTAPHLLVVTESRSQAQNAVDLACKLGFQAAIAANAREALESIQTHPPRIILTTTTLPDMELKAFAHQARRTLQNHPVMIVAWSSSAQAEEQLLQPESGIDDFVLKAPSAESANYLVTALLSSLR